MDNLKDCPALAGYLARVGAVQKSLRRFDIEGELKGGYRNAVATIKVDAEGTLSFLGEVEKPTEAEAAAIKAEIVLANWPQSVPAPQRSLPDELKGKDPDTLFRFMSRDGETILFLQHRVEKDDGKEYRPWSYWSDNQWRQMEPDGLLPLYGLDKIQHHTVAFIHEGARGARYCQWMIEAELQDAKKALAAHPWAQELGGAVHLGWAGGAKSPHRTDWAALRRAGIKRLYVVADNDFDGKEAIRKISALTRLNTMCVMFDDRFKKGFDLADPWPDQTAQPTWWRGERYIGPAFHEMLVPCTWATRRIETGQKGRPSYALRDDFVQQWTFSARPPVFVHQRFPHIMMSLEVFNTKVAPYSDVEDVGRLLAKHPAAQADGLTYRPMQPEKFARIIAIDGERKINTYRPPSIKAMPGDASPFLRFMVRLIPDRDDRRKVARWCATLIARPEVRMRYSLLLISERQGTGKSTLGNILRQLIGPSNVSMPSEQTITDSDFNSWRAHKRLAIVNEIYSGDRRKCYDRLKGVISDDDFDVHLKHQDPYPLENYLHALACSNSMKALHLEDDDRRFLVPTVTEELRPQDYWREFYAWLEGGGLAAIAYWAEGYVRKHGAVPTGEHAPATARKREIIAELRSDGSRLAYDLAEMVRDRKNDRGEKIETVLRMDEVRAWVAEMRGLKAGAPMETVATLRKVMQDAGLLRPKNLAGRPRRVAIGKMPVEVLANFEIGPDAKWEAFSPGRYVKPGELIAAPM
ncbi:MAG: primase-helicase family protein [Pseudomonadota bacterium]